MIHPQVESEKSAGLLTGIEKPAQLRALSSRELTALAQEIRQEIIETVAVHGGHLAPNLGTVELTLALHIAFDSPRDKLVWDIGHQAYSHKLITGRYKRFRTIKQLGGLSGYLRRDESEHDSFGASHASTSISAALGMAFARDLRGESYQVVSIIGDGALSGGMALEAINHAGASGKRLIIVLNDNNKSISDNVGALHSYFKRVRTRTSSRRQHLAKEAFLDGLADKTDVIFAELGFTFLGPIDGHNIPELVSLFRTAKELEGPVLVHVLTEKGRGCAFAQADPTAFHGPGAYDPLTGKQKINPAAPPKYQDVFANALVELAQRDSTIVGITAGMAEGTSLTRFHQALPDRFVDVGICEQHAVTLAAGMACEGARPVAAIYSTFLQRAFDQIIHDVCVQNLHVVFAMDRAGLVGEDGQTQHGVFDIGYLRMIPNMRILAPRDENELRHMLYTALYMDGPVALRYPRGSGTGVPLDTHFSVLPVGKAEVLTSEGEIEQADCAIIAYGHMVQTAVQVGRELDRVHGIRAVVVNARWAKPLDQELISRLARATGCLITVEDAVASCGFGSAVSELLRELDLYDVRLRTIGLPDLFVEHGPAPVLRELYGLGVDSIVADVLSVLKAVARPRYA